MERKKAVLDRVSRRMLCLFGCARHPRGRRRRSRAEPRRRRVRQWVDWQRWPLDLSNIPPNSPPKIFDPSTFIVPDSGTQMDPEHDNIFNFTTIKIPAGSPSS